MDVIIGKECFKQIREELEKERIKRNEDWETPLIAYTLSILCETFGPLKRVIKAVLRMKGSISSTVVPRMRTAFQGLLHQYKMREALDALSEHFQSQENYKYIRMALMNPPRIMNRKETIVNDFKRLSNARESKVEKYSEIASLTLFLVFFLPFLGMYSLLLLGKILFLPSITLLQLGSCYIARHKLFYELS